MDLHQIIQNYKASIRPELQIDISKTGFVYTHPEGNFIIDFNAPNIDHDLIFCFTLDALDSDQKTKIRPLRSLFGMYKNFTIACDLLVVIGIKKNEDRKIYLVAIEFKDGKYPYKKQTEIEKGFRQVAASLEFLSYCNKLHCLFHECPTNVQRRKFVITRGKPNKTATHLPDDYSRYPYPQMNGEKTLITDLINRQK